MLEKVRILFSVDLATLPPFLATRLSLVSGLYPGRQDLNRSA